MESKEPSGVKRITEYANGKPVTQKTDENDDGKPEQIVSYNAEGVIEKIVTDTNKDERFDVQQFYKNGDLILVQQDRNHDGKTDIETEHENGKRICTRIDDDGDGRFETTHRYGTAKWTSVTEIDENGDGKPESRFCFIDGTMRMKEIFDGRSGQAVLLEEFDEAGKIKLSKEIVGAANVLNMTWHYDDKETAVLGEKDKDGDGRPDIWFHYENERVVRVEEDRNKDGKPDLWEIYDASEAVVSRKEDLDYDGVPDITTDG